MGAPSAVGPYFNVCFHGIGTPQREREPGEARYWVARDRFLQILDSVAASPSVAISFDDGNRSDVDIALPALVDRDLTATFFPVVGRLSDGSSVSPAGLEELVKAGMGIGSHGMHHVPWPGLRGQAARTELVDARRVLEDLLHQRVDIVSAPLGRYDRRILTLLRASGCTELNVSDQRPARPGAWIQPRFSVRSDDTAASLRSRMLASLRPVRRLRNGTVAQLKQRL